MEVRSIPTYRVKEVDEEGKLIIDSPLRGAIVHSFYLPQQGSYIYLGLTRTELEIIHAEVDLEVSPDLHQKREDRVYRVVGIEHTVSAMPLIDLSFIADFVDRVGKEGLEILCKGAGQEPPQGNPSETIRKNTREMQDLARDEKTTGVQHMGSYDIVYVQKVSQDKRPKFI